MRKLIVFLWMAAVMVLFLGESPTLAAQNKYETSFPAVKVIELEKEVLELDVPQELYEIPAKPHFLLGVNKVPEAGIEQMFELRKLYQMKGKFYSNNGGIYIDKSAQNFGLDKNKNYLQLTSNIEVAGKKVFVIFAFYLLNNTKDREYIYMSPLGPKNLAEFSEKLYRKYEVQWSLGKITDKKWTDIKRVLGWAQFEAVKRYLFQNVQLAVKKDVADYANLVPQVIERLKKDLNDEEVDQVLQNPVPGLEGFSVADVLMVPNTKAESFVPNILVFGALPFAWGIANWKAVGCEKIVFYDILGAAWDYIVDQPLVLAHEFVHTNPYLQRQPATLYFDIEMWTGLTTNFYETIWYWWDWYLAVPRDTAHTYFGYDAKEAIKRMMPYDYVMLRDIRVKEFNANLKRVREIQKALLSFIPKFMANFYSDIYFWNAINMKWCDTAAAWRIMMAFEFEPATIFNPRKIDKITGRPIPASAQTKMWLERQNASGKLRKLAEETMKKTGELTKLGVKMSKIEDYNDTIKCPSPSGMYYYSKEKRMEVERMLDQLIRENDPRDLSFLAHFMHLRRQ